MAEYNILDSFTMRADGDLSQFQNHIIRVSGLRTVGLATDPADPTIIGVLHGAPGGAGRATSVAYIGLSKLVAGAAIDQGKMLTTNASGRAIAITSGTASVCIGRAIEAAEGDGNIISCLLTPPTLWAGAN